MEKVIKTEVQRSNKHMKKFNLSYNERNTNRNMILLIFFICQIGKIKNNHKRPCWRGCWPPHSEARPEWRRERPHRTTEEAEKAPIDRQWYSSVNSPASLNISLLTEPGGARGKVHACLEKVERAVWGNLTTHIHIIWTQMGHAQPSPPTLIC